MVKEIIGPDETISKDALEILNKCGVDFIKMLTTEANEIAEGEGKNWVGEEHFMQALKDLGFEAYLEKVKEAAQEHHEQEKEVWQNPRRSGTRVHEQQTDAQYRSATRKRRRSWRAPR
jgi:histone H3/H4